MSNTAETLGWVRESAGPASILRPETWTRLELGDADLPDLDGVDLIVARNESSSLFRMNVVVTHAASAASIEEVSSEVIATAFAEHPGALVYECSAWPFAEHPGRFIEFSYPADELSVVVSRWAFATGRNQIHLVASRSSDEFVLSDEYLRAIGSSIEFSAEA